MSIYEIYWDMLISTTENYARADEKMKRKALMSAYDSPINEELLSWKKTSG